MPSLLKNKHLLLLTGFLAGLLAIFALQTLFTQIQLRKIQSSFPVTPQVTGETATAPEISTSPHPTDVLANLDWMNYTDESLAFEFSIPNSWTIKPASESSDNRLTVDSPDGLYSISPVLKSPTRSEIKSGQTIKRNGFTSIIMPPRTEADNSNNLVGTNQAFITLPDNRTILLTIISKITSGASTNYAASLLEKIITDLK